MEKTYQCICGRTFDKPNGFNAHKRHCKQHLESIGKYDQYLENQSKFKKAGSEKAKQKHLEAERLSKDTLINWISEQHRCEKCGEIMTEKFGPGRFCSRKCANTKEFDQESRIKKSNSLNANFKVKLDLYNSAPIICPHCAYIVEYKDRKRKICPECNHYLDGRRKKYMNKAVVPLEKVKARDLDVEYTGPELPSYIKKIRAKGFFKRTELSYAEQFWKKVLDSNEINYQHNFKVKKANGGSYYLDFLIDDYFDLEIDGSQHQFSVLKDLNRTFYLESLGYKCFRLSWVNPNNDTNKMIVNCQIDQLFKELGKERLV